MFFAEFVLMMVVGEIYVNVMTYNYIVHYLITQHLLL